MRRVFLSFTTVAATAALLAGPATAASPPSVSTGPAKSVGFQSAVLTGSINPNGDGTSYYFQYGLTKGYTAQTPIAGAGAGTKSVAVKVPIAGLSPVTVYHYRLVAVSSAGVSFGADHHFTTTKIPLSLSIISFPNPVSFGGTVTIQGTLSGTENVSRKVVLEARSWPFTASFAPLPNINAELTTATGGFNFTVPGLGAATEFRVVTATNPPVISAVAGEGVVVRVISHIARTHRRGFVRFYGTVTPAVDGAQVGIMRVAGQRGVLAGGTILTHRDATSSKFSRVVRAHRGVYRILVRVVGASVGSSYGQPLRIR